MRAALRRRGADRLSSVVSKIETAFVVDVDHSVVGGDEHRRIVRQVGGERDKARSTRSSSRSRPGVRTVHMPGLVEVAPVEVDQPATGSLRLGEGLGAAFLKGLRVPESAAAQRCPVEPASGELLLAEADHIDAGIREALEERRIGHPGDGVDIEVPRQLVEHRILLRVQDA